MKVKVLSDYDRALRGRMRNTLSADKVLSLLKRAYRGGDLRAGYALATWMLYGVNMAKNEKEGMRLLLEAAEGRVPDALYDLATSYESGDGVRKNLRRAHELYMRAALSGDTGALHEVGRCYFYGIGCAKDRRMADIWLEAHERRESATKGAERGVMSRPIRAVRSVRVAASLRTRSGRGGR